MTCKKYHLMKKYNGFSVCRYCGFAELEKEQGKK